MIETMSTSCPRIVFQGKDGSSFCCLLYNCLSERYAITSIRNHSTKIGTSLYLSVNQTIHTTPKLSIKLLIHQAKIISSIEK